MAAGEPVLDVPPKLAARVRLLASGNVNKNDPNDARSVAVAALRSAACQPVRAEDHAAVLKIWAKRHRDLSRARNQVVCRLHAVLCDLVPGGVSKSITVGQAARVLEQVQPRGAAGAARRALPVTLAGRPCRPDPVVRCVYWTWRRAGVARWRIKIRPVIYHHRGREHKIRTVSITGAADSGGMAPAGGGSAGPASRRRGKALEQALLDAAWEELAEAGYANVTMEGVAARAGTSKPVLYRRWRSRAELVIAAVRAHLPEVTPARIPDTGSLRGDLVAVLAVASEWFDGPVRQALHGVMSDFYRDPRLSASLHADMFGNAAKVMPVILRRAAGRGEVDLDRISPRVGMLAFDLFRHELLTSSAPIPAATVTGIIDEVFLPLVRQTEVPAAPDRPPTSPRRAAP